MRLPAEGQRASQGIGANPGPGGNRQALIPAQEIPSRFRNGSSAKGLPRDEAVRASDVAPKGA